MCIALMTAAPSPAAAATPAAELQAIEESTAATEVFAEWGHSCALLTDGTVKCWGLNYSSELGDGTDEDRNTRVSATVTGITDATQITGGCALLTDGTVKCWGSDSDGGTIEGITDATQITGGCALLTNGTVKCWGYDRYGNPAEGITDVAQITDSCALLTNGTIKCWGDNTYGQLGDGTDGEQSITPVTVTGITDATQISTGFFQSCALLIDGTIKCWGRNALGALGDGTNEDRNTPVTVTEITDATQVTTANGHSCALLADGTIKCWGFNGAGQLGDGTNANRLTPVTVTGITDATQITTDNDHSCALLADASIKCWGWNYLGQLGDGTTEDRNTPVAVVLEDTTDGDTDTDTDTEEEEYTNCRQTPVNPAFDVSTGDRATVYRLYCAYFLRYPDDHGFDYWVDLYRHEAIGLSGISAEFAASEEFTLKYGSLTNDEFIDLIYRNIMQRDPDTDGYNYWLNLLNNGDINRGEALLYFSDSEEFKLKTGTN